MKIINFGNTAFTNYLLLFQDGAVLIDAGFKDSYSVFLDKLKRFSVDLNLIKYVVLTHVHSDHISYLHDLLSNNDITVIAGADSARKIKLGQDEIKYFSSKISRFYSKILTFFKITPAKWKSFDLNNYKVKIVDTIDSETLKEFGLTLFPLMGHTEDSIGMISEDKTAFVGDHLMGIYPAKRLVPLLIEDIKGYKKSNEDLIGLAPKIIYIGHGKPVTTENLLKNAGYVKSLKIYS